ncbi:MAG: sulfate adenylyltransferase [Chloroflexi bacterium]|nr:sulfate adenylyltransferase [Chloroflexota bacterium]
MKGPISPHGGKLVSRLLPPDVAQALKERLPLLKKLHLNEREVSDLELIGVGAFSPLEGFMGQEDYLSVVANMRLASGLPWSLPVTLSATTQEAAGLREGESVALLDETGRPRGVLHLEEKFSYVKAREAKEVYRTQDEAHPGVAALYRQREVLLGGKVDLLEPVQHPLFPRNYMPPSETRALFARLGWRRIVGFQTRNPVHRAHEYILKCALETMDGLFFHPLVGETKSDDIPAEVRMRCYEVLLAEHFPPGRVVLAILPAAMRYAGPREAIFHAIVRKNYGCTHLIVGRDHAGVGNYYGPFDAHHIFDEFQPGELGIEPLFFDNAFYCKVCGGMATIKTCRHDAQERVALSGTQVRAMLQEGKLPPPEFTRPEVARILLESTRGSS